MSTPAAMHSSTGSSDRRARRVDARRNDRDQSRDVAGRWREPAKPGQDEIPHRGRNGAILRGEQLGQQQRVAAAALEQVAGVDARRARPARRRTPSTTVRSGTARTTCRGRTASVARSGCSGSDLVVPVRQDEHGGQPFDPPAQEHHQVVGRLVGPVRVLDDHDAARSLSGDRSAPATNAPNSSDWLARASTRSPRALRRPGGRCRAAAPTPAASPAGRTSPARPAPERRSGRRRPGSGLDFPIPASPATSAIRPASGRISMHLLEHGQRIGSLPQRHRRPSYAHRPDTDSLCPPRARQHIRTVAGAGRTHSRQPARDSVR